MQRWIIDTDGGIDDCQALVLALKAGSEVGFQVAAITLVAGNVAIDKVSRNVRECIRVCGREDIPCHLGATRPLVRAFSDASAIHGSSGLGGYWDSAPVVPLPPEHPEPAVAAILRMANSSPGEISIVTIGPLTNLALAVTIDPLLPTKLRRVVLMCGAETGNGNTETVSEFNIAWDPEAAQIIFDRFPSVEILSWECVINPIHEISVEFIEEVLGGRKPTPAAQFLSKARSPMKWLFCDPMAVALAMDPGIAVKTEKCRVWVALEGNRSRGRTLIDHKSQSPNATFAKVIDIPRFRALLLNSIN